MDLIVIPDSYWTIRPAGFAARVQAFGAELDTTRGDLFRGVGGILDGNRGDIDQDLALSDSADPQMRAAAAVEYNITANEQTGQMLSRFGPGDSLALGADRATPADQVANPGGVNYPPAPPEVPPPDQPPDVPNTLDASSAPAPAAPLEPRAAAPAATAESAPATTPTASGLPTYDQVNNAYWQDMGRGASVDDYNAFWAGRTDWREAIYASDEAQAYREQQRQAAMPPAGAYVSPDQLAAALSNLDLTIHVMV